MKDGFQGQAMQHGGQVLCTTGGTSSKDMDYNMKKEFHSMEDSSRVGVLNYVKSVSRCRLRRAHN